MEAVLSLSLYSRKALSYAGDVVAANDKHVVVVFFLGQPSTRLQLHVLFS